MLLLPLPSILPGTLDLADLNARVRAGEVRLDWSAVVAVTASLAPLFANIPLDSGADALGLATIPDDLSTLIAARLDDLSDDWAWGTPPAADTADGAQSDDADLATPADDADTDDAGTPTDDADADDADSLTDDADTDTPAPILRHATQAELRDRLQAMVLADLLGPAGGPEEIVTEDHVSDRYLLGMLAPRRKPIASGEQDDLGTVGPTDAEEGAEDLTATPAPGFIPSSFGFSCAVVGDATHITLTAAWGRYERVTDAADRAPPSLHPPRVWQRCPMGGARTIPLAPGPVEFAPDPAQPEVTIGGVVRRRGARWICTFFLKNDQAERERNRDAAWLFQAELSATDPAGQPIFCQGASGPAPDLLGLADEEAAAMRLRFRHAVEFATGHGIAVSVAAVPGLDRATRIATSAAPTYEIGRTAPPPLTELPDLVLDMRTLAESDDAALVAALAPLPLAYAAWLDRQAARVADPPDDLREHRAAAAAAVAEGRATLTRIQQGIAILKADPRARQAFRFMNRAMWQQRVHTLAAEAVRQGKRATVAEFDEPKHRTWFQFQIAFILLNLPALTDPAHPDRAAGQAAIVDLLWFPTGGGKTEAYLGLTAYTLAMRRLQHAPAERDSDEGVAVLMRYTLRLLTLQQFQRAAALICACEVQRCADPVQWGATPFRLGLWVGMHTTPNWTDDSQEALRTQRNEWYRPGFGGTPAQLTFCPWCGARIEIGRDIKVRTYALGAGRTLIFCGDPLGECPFSEGQSPEEGLPVLVVDEEIYRRLPALLIATVDKFAQLPWKGAVGMLFGQVDGWCPRHGFQGPGMPEKMRCGAHPRRGQVAGTHIVPRHPLRPPDLIIQDELHLISGPLGTLVGLYETVVDALATWQYHDRPVRPKIVASTATIRRAADQVLALFNREVRVFPPGGIDDADNFFARRRDPTPSDPGRRYLGICAPGRRMKQTLIRVYVAFLAAAQTLYATDGYGAAVDPWMTLVGYFNTVRDLAGMKRLVEDDVRSRLLRVTERGLAERRVARVEELTSRRSSADIPRILDLLGLTFDGRVKRRRRRNEPREPSAPNPVDVLLATNMISVGVDVRRLGLMVVAGQPKTTSEYIQATSRVGRLYPGLVCTVYHWARPRDLSHYEHFAHYHATLYQHVEALSVTPFAPRALDRGLGALLAALVRQTAPTLANNAGAGAIGEHLAVLDASIAAIVARAASVTGDAVTDELVRRELAARRRHWLSEAARGNRLLGYEDQRDSATVGLLRRPSITGWTSFTCLNSLRDVEPEVHLVLDDSGMDRDADRPWLPAPQAEEAEHD